MAGDAYVGTLQQYCLAMLNTSPNAISPTPTSHHLGQLRTTSTWCAVAANGAKLGSGSGGVERTRTTLPSEAQRSLSETYATPTGRIDGNGRHEEGPVGYPKSVALQLVQLGPRGNVLQHVIRQARSDPPLDLPVATPLDGPFASTFEEFGQRLPINQLARHLVRTPLILTHPDPAAPNVRGTEPARPAAPSPIPTPHQLLLLRTRRAWCEVAVNGAKWGWGGGRPDRRWGAA